MHHTRKPGLWRAIGRAQDLSQMTMCPCIVWASCARVGVQASATSRMDAPDDEKVKAQPVSGLEDQRAPRPVEPEVLAYDGDHPLCATRQPQKRQSPSQQLRARSNMTSNSLATHLIWTCACVCVCACLPRCVWCPPLVLVCVCLSGIRAPRNTPQTRAQTHSNATRAHVLRSRGKV